MKKTSLLILIAIMLLVACQPNPDKEIIINNNQDFLEPQSSPKQADADWQLKVPQKWIENISPIANFNIKVNAEIEAIKASGISIAEVSLEKFTEEKMKSIIDYFCKDNKLFYWPSVRTKAQLEKELVEYKRGALVDDEYIPPDPNDPYIKELERKIQNAPTNNKRKYYTERELAEELQSTKFTLGVELEENRDGIIMIDNPANEEYDSKIAVDFGGNFLNENELAMNDLKIGEILISEGEAVEIGENTLFDLGIDFMKLAKIEKYRVLRSGNLEGAFSNYESNGYMLSYSREYSGLYTPDFTENGVYVQSDDLSAQDYLPEYSAPWFQETISIYIDENGVQRFSWYGYCKLGETLQEDVKLLEFDRIKEIASKQLYYQNSANLVENSVRTVDVDRVMLGLSLINKRNAPKEGILVPAWYFIFKLSQSDYSNQKGESVLKDVGVLVINAIDGSVINPLPIN